MKQQPIHIIGAGMAGVEAAMMIAKHGFDVTLWEMKPQKFSPAHQSKDFAELVCSNSFGSMAPNSAPELLKSEMRDLGSVILSHATEAAVPAGRALGVDRELFSKRVTQTIESHPRITICREECKDLPEGIVVIASGPMTSDAFSDTLASLTGKDTLYFYDSISPIVHADSIDMEQVYFGSRYEPENDDYLNCPMNKEQYETFVQAIADAEKVEVKNFEAMHCFEDCQPIENLVDRGLKTLAFGPMKPVGLPNPKTQKTPYAVVQLRRENMPTTMYNLVGFQTRMKWGEQKRIFQTIPGLQKAEFVRMGSMHRNTYIHSPSLLQEDLSFQEHPNVYVAGQLTGVEGYVESAAMGQMVGLSIVSRLTNTPWFRPPADTAMGALMRVITTDPLKSDFSPMNINFGLLPPLQNPPTMKLKKKERRKAMFERGRTSFQTWYHEAFSLPKNKAPSSQASVAC